MVGGEAIIRCVGVETEEEESERERESERASDEWAVVHSFSLIQPLSVGD